MKNKPISEGEMTNKTFSFGATGVPKGTRKITFLWGELKGSIDVQPVKTKNEK